MLIFGLINSLIKLNYNFSVQVQWRSKTGMYIQKQIIFLSLLHMDKMTSKGHSKSKILLWLRKSTTRRQSEWDRIRKDEKCHSFRKCWQWASRYKHHQDHLRSTKRIFPFVPLFGGNKSFVSELVGRSTSIEFQYNY